MQIDLFDEWRIWINKIYEDFRRILTIHYVYQEIQKIIEENPSIQFGNLFFWWLDSVYCDSIVIAIRRHLDRRRGSKSLWHLLNEIKRKPENLSRLKFIKLWKLENERRAHLRFNELAGNGKHINPIILEKDIKKLEQKAEKVKSFANDRIAHLNFKELNELPTYAEFEDCILFLKETIYKYQLLFNGADYKIRFSNEWKSIFKEKWIET